MKYSGGFNVTLPTDREILLMRTFDAPRAVVFDMWTSPEHVTHWWDPSGVPLSSCEIDLRPGGSFRWVNNSDSGEHAFTGTYREIVPPKRLVFTVKISPSSAGALAELLFSQEGSQTKLTMRIACASPEDRDALLQMRVDAGTGRTLENLAVYLEHVKVLQGERL